MSKTQTKKKEKRRKVTFSFEAANAKEVILMGDFNSWNPKSHPMKPVGDGVWNKSVILAPGQYEYKFLIDGNWREDPQNSQACSNCFGSLNSILNLTAP